MGIETTTRMSIYLPKRLADLAEQIANEEKTSKSNLIVRLLENMELEREQALMEEGYRTLAQEQQNISDIAFQKQADIALGQ